MLDLAEFINGSDHLSNSQSEAAAGLTRSSGAGTDLLNF